MITVNMKDMVLNQQFAQKMAENLMKKFHLVSTFKFQSKEFPYAIADKFSNALQSRYFFAFFQKYFKNFSFDKRESYARGGVRLPFEFETAPTDNSPT